MKDFIQYMAERWTIPILVVALVVVIVLHNSK